jgi:hypothetical protein
MPRNTLLYALKEFAAKTNDEPNSPSYRHEVEHYIREIETQGLYGFWVEIHFDAPEPFYATI